MAALTRLRLGYFAKNYPHLLKNKNGINYNNFQSILFHFSPLLNVKGQEIKMPSLSPTMSEGTIVKWMKKEGDKIQPGDVLCDIQTDKAVVSMETEEEGILAKIIVPENATDIKVGTLIAVMVGEDEDWKSVEVSSGGSLADASSSPSEAVSEATAVGGPPTVQVNMPALSPTMTEGTIVKWLKQEGDTIAPGDVLCDIQTDKAVMSMETDEEGVLAKILKPDDSKDVKIGTLIALIVAEGEDWKSVVVPSASVPVKPAASSTAQQQPKVPAPSSASHQHTGANFGPAVRSLLEIYHLDPGSIQASGRNNKLLKGDVLQYINTNRLQKKPPKPVSPPGKSAKETKSVQPETRPSGRQTQKYVDIELSNVRRVIAKRLTQSKQEIPHSYGNIRCNIDNLLGLRKELQKQDVKVSVNDFVIKTVATALERCPEVNAHYVTDGVKLVDAVDISVAVATDNGLITPIIKSANRKGVVEISHAVKELAAKARAGKLKPDEFQGGSFTISNLGMFGISHFSAIINPPQCAILAVGGGIQSVGEDLKPHTDITVTLSYDRRAIQEDEAANFLQTLRQLLEDPRNILVGQMPGQKARAEY